MESRIRLRIFLAFISTFISHSGVGALALLAMRASVLRSTSSSTGGLAGLLAAELHLRLHSSCIISSMHVPFKGHHTCIRRGVPNLDRPALHKLHLPCRMVFKGRPTKRLRHCYSCYRVPIQVVWLPVPHAFHCCVVPPSQLHAR